MSTIVRARRFGWTDADVTRAEDYMHTMAGVGRMYHTVEVYDEGMYDVASQPGEPVGVVYVVRDEGLAVFVASHTCDQGAPMVLNTKGVSPDELDD